MGKRTSALKVAAPGFVATGKPGGYAVDRTDADMSLTRLETKGVSNKSELMGDVVAVPKVSAKYSRNVRDLAAYAEKGTDLDRYDVAMNKITDGATINYLARCSTSDTTQLALLRSSKLDVAAVANFSRSTNVVVRTAAKNHPNYKPSAAEWPAHALNRLLHGRRTAA